MDEWLIFLCDHKNQMISNMQFTVVRRFHKMLQQTFAISALIEQSWLLVGHFSLFKPFISWFLASY